MGTLVNHAIFLVDVSIVNRKMQFPYAIKKVKTF